ncbi:MAG: type II secretion system protein GspG [Patescibacteria group bacterium]
MASATLAANSVSKHEIKNSLELYYLDYGTYPMTSDSAEMLDRLYKDEYIESKPVDSFKIEYNVLKGGEDYILN